MLVVLAVSRVFIRAGRSAGGNLADDVSRAERVVVDRDQFTRERCGYHRRIGRIR
jgi:hypothetical protein